MEHLRKGRTSPWAALLGLFLTLAAILPHVTSVLAAGGAGRCLPQHHGIQAMEALQDHREPMPRSLPAQVLLLPICCGLLDTGSGPVMPVIAPAAADADYAPSPAPDFASLAIPPEPRPPRS